VVTRPGRWKTVCARGAYRTLLCGPSTSPLGAIAAMTPRIHATIAAMALLLVAEPVPAPIVGEFPGLSNLIAYSEHIVVALVVTEPKEPRLTTFNASQPQMARVLYVLMELTRFGGQVMVFVSNSRLRCVSILAAVQSAAAGGRSSLGGCWITPRPGRARAARS